MARMFHRSSGPSPNKVFLATPAISIEAGYTYALFNSAKALDDAGFGYELAIYAGDCHVDDARNRLVRDFLETDCTDLVFLDADVRWEPESLVKLLQYDVDVVAGVYPLKQQDEGYPVMPLEGDRNMVDGLIEVEGVPTGFLRIKRHVLQTLADKAQKFKPKSDNRSKLPLIFERTMEDGRRWGGDYTFCRKWRELGGKIYVDPEIFMEHNGSWNWKGRLGDFWRKEAGLEPARLKPLLDKCVNGGSLEDFLELREVWGNPYAAPASMLMTMVKLAREGTGLILETGTGLSTLLLNACCCRAYSLEHDLAHYQSIKKLLTRYELPDDGVIYAPLVEQTGWYFLPEHMPGNNIGLVICDGPPRNTDSRFVLWDQLQISGAIWMVDDCRADEIRGRKMELIEDVHPWIIGRPQHGE